MKFKIRTNDYGQIYMPKEVRDELGRRLELLSDTNSALLFPEGTSPTHVLRSLRVIIADLRHRVDLEKERRREEESDRCSIRRESSTSR